MVHWLALYQRQLLTLLLSGPITRDVDLVARPWHGDGRRLKGKLEVAVLVSVHGTREDVLIHPDNATKSTVGINTHIQGDIRGSAAFDFNWPFGHMGHVLRCSDFQREIGPLRETRRRISGSHLGGKLGTLHLPIHC